MRYVRLPVKGGIDRDMAIAFSMTSSDFCWLFSGDDIMRPGALARALDVIGDGHDVYLSQHMEYRGKEIGWIPWPFLSPGHAATFDFSDPAQRARYFSSAVNTEALLSFMGGAIMRRVVWDRVPFNEDFNGSCWAHAARFFALMQTGLRLRFIPECWQDRRPDNDSFSRNGLVARLSLTIDGYHRIADTFFGHGSTEAFHVRRAVRDEIGIGSLIMGKYVCTLDPELEKRSEIDRLAAKMYGDFSFRNLYMRMLYARTPAERIKVWDPEWSAKEERNARLRLEGRRLPGG